MITSVRIGWIAAALSGAVVAVAGCGGTTSDVEIGAVDGGADATVANGGTSGGNGGASGGNGGASGGNGGASGGGGTSSGGGGTGTGTGGSGSTDGGSPAPSGDAAPPPAGGTLRFVAFGDSRDDPDTHQKVVDALAKKNPQLVLDTGDLWAGYGSAQWAQITNSNPNVAALLSSNLYLVSRGNHESVSELLAFKPTLVRDGNETYGFALGNSFFVSLGMDPSKATAFLAQQLQRPEAKSAKWRFVFSHYPIYDSGDTHGVDGVPAVEKVCDQYHVTAYFSGHEHIYERSYQMFGQKVVDKGDALQATHGTVYVVSGGAGAPFYDVTTPLPSSRLTKTHVNHYVLVDAAATGLDVGVYDTDGNAFDHFTVSP